jgi:hypothetical protein
MEIFPKSPSVPATFMTQRRSFPFLIALLIFSTLHAQDSTPSSADVNSALGVQLFDDDNLWDDDANATARRLGWPLESETSTDSSFRKYPGSEERILDCRPYSTVLLAEQKSPSSLSLVFANKGDAVIYSTSESNRETIRTINKQLRELPNSIREDKNKIQSALSQLFGEPVGDRYGQGRETRENVKRWDWNGHAFLLASPRDEYVALRIMPTESADAGGKSRILDSEIRARVSSRVENRPNGDVILIDMPMVDQGPKGYCVPATWERVMRYMGIPADMYVLAMAGQTKEGGGTNLTDIAEGARESVISSGRKIERVKIKPNPINVSKYIDRGLPLIWAMFSTNEFNEAANSRKKMRLETATDSKDWKKTLSEARKSARKFKKFTDTAHVCMIIGYNKETGEIAISDSWGPEFAERWVTPEEAEAISQNDFQIITF